MWHKALGAKRREQMTDDSEEAEKKVYSCGSDMNRGSHLLMLDSPSEIRFAITIVNFTPVPST
jgi:hypothetical protein